MSYMKNVCGYIHIDTPCGKLKGIQKNGHVEFKGIRYATAERWEDPVVVSSWDGEYDATKYGPCCPQNDAFSSQVAAPFSLFYYNQNLEKPIYYYDEANSLNLNIWAPDNAKDLPVFVFIHGGSFQTGCGYAPNITKGEVFCAKGVIYITINYRLNAFATGFGGGHFGNYGLKDDIAALKWIQRNIAAFGGNPQKIVIAGESAGAMSVQLLLWSRESKELFCGAIQMSGGGFLPAMAIPADRSYAENVWAEVMHRNSVSTFEEMKDWPDSKVFSKWSEVYSRHPEWIQAAYPIIDGTLISGTPETILSSDQTIDVPCILGMSSEDIWPYSMYQQYVSWAEYRNSHCETNTYLYYLDRQPPGGDCVGAYHGLDMWYAFGTLDRNWRPFDETDYRISENMVDYFTNFVKYLNPNGPTVPEWKSYKKGEASFIHLGDEPATMCNPPLEKIKNAIQNTEKPFPGM